MFRCLIFCWFSLFIVIEADIDGEWNVQNLTPLCMQCLCQAATRCQIERQCDEEPGYCGPFKISPRHWIFAGNITLPGDNPERAGAYEDCTNNYFCAQKVIAGHLQRAAKDCNDDGVTDCYDFMLINFNGQFACKTPLEENAFGSMWLERYNYCMANHVE